MTLVIALVFCSTGILAASAESSSTNILNEIDMLSIIEGDLETPEGDEIKGPFTLDEIAKEMATIEGISVKDALQKLSSGNDKIEPSGVSDYYTYTRSVTVTSTYKPKLVFYCNIVRVDIQPIIFLKIEHASLNRSYNGTSKQFAGHIYYNLENNTRFYYELNGDFYNNGTTTYTGGASVNVGEYDTINFSVSSSSNFYKYCYDSGRIYI